MDAGRGFESWYCTILITSAKKVQIFHLRILLFESTFASKPWLLALGLTACLQLAGAVLCILDAAPSSKAPWLKYASVPILHSGWTLYQIVLLLWIYWICSVGGTKSVHEFWGRIAGNWRLLWLLVTPPLLSAIIGAIPFSLWYQLKTTFLVS